MKRIAVLTSGGDAPGMNAAIRAIVRSGLSCGLEVLGAKHGFRGLIENDLHLLLTGDMANIIQRGGTVLKTARVPEWHERKIRAKAIENLKSLQIEGLAVIGGDGSFRGASALFEDHAIPTVCLPATIDNDIAGTELTIGFDTAVNAAIEAIDRIRDTAESHDRLFVIEVMGRDSGFIAMDTALASGAEEVFFTQSSVTVEQAVDHIKQSQARGKKSSILVTAEGQKPGRAYDLADMIRKKSGLEAKVCVLGHIQRGGAPSARDRVLAAQMGALGVKTLIEQMALDPKGRASGPLMIALRQGQVQTIELSHALQQKKHVSQESIRLARTLSS